jgi:nucleotidyltransferase/DNA polymerase involved in DNA repair
MPLAVGTSKESEKYRGVIQTCNYIARKFGVRSGMPTTNAYKLCPNLIYLESDDKYYSDISNKIMRLLHNYNRKIEQMSVDEAAMEVIGLNYDESYALGMEIKNNIKNEVGLTCTIGISFGPVFAKMACDASKPDGFMIIKEGEIRDFLKDKKISKLPGIGPKTELRMIELGIKTIGDLATYNPISLSKKFGSIGLRLHELANGIDNEKISDKNDRLSIGRERTLNVDTFDINELSKMIDILSAEVYKEVLDNNYWFKGIGIKVKYSDFNIVTRNKHFENNMDSLDSIKNTATTLIKPLIKKDIKIRKIGVKVFDINKIGGQKKL